MKTEFEMYFLMSTMIMSLCLSQITLMCLQELSIIVFEITWCPSGPLRSPEWIFGFRNNWSSGLNSTWSSGLYSFSGLHNQAVTVFAQDCGWVRVEQSESSSLFSCWTRTWSPQSTYEYVAPLLVSA